MSERFINFDLTKVYTSSDTDVPALMERYSENGNEYVFLQGVANTVTGSAVTFNEAGVSTLLVADAKGPVAIAQAAVNSTSKKGWYLISGSCLVATANDVADNGNMYATATAGRVDDAVVAGDRIKGAWFRAAGTGATTVLAQFNYPYADDIAD
jgi:hypothetical protein